MKLTKILLILILSVSLQAQDAELGKRYLKLGNSYRETGEMDKAAEFLKKGTQQLAKAKGFEDAYWNAVANEYYGYLYRDLGMPSTARDYFTAALNGYSKVIEQNDGSQVAMQKILNSLSGMSGNGNGAIAGCNDDFIKNGMDNFTSGNYEAAIAQFTNAINCSQMTDLAYFMRARAYQMLGENEKAAADFQMSAELNPLLSNIGNAIIWNDLDEAVENSDIVYFLNLDNQGITSIPMDDIKKLKKLVNLSLNNNALSDLPDSISELSNLQVISLQANPLQSLPDNLDKLKNLKELNLRYVYLPPNEIVRITKELPKSTRIIFE